MPVAAAVKGADAMLSTIPRVDIRRLLAVVCWLIPGSAIAQFSCDVSIGSSVAFGQYDPTSGTAGIATASATLTCTHLGGGAQRINWDMTLTNGASGSCSARRMSGPGTDILNYNIYVNNIAGGVWGNAGCGSFPSGQITVTNGAPNNVKTVSNVLYGQLPSGQFGAGAGIYADNLTLTITFN